jgi:hypothetical protein
VTLRSEDRQLLKELPMQLLAAISVNREDPNFRRLFPPAYAGDAKAEEEYRELVGTELDQARSLALETLSKTAGATELTEQELDAWLRALNDIRLWLGTVLDVSEDDADEEPDDPPHILYQVLTVLQELAVSALAGEE